MSMDEWRSSLSHIDLQSEEVRRRLVEAVENCKILIDWFQSNISDDEAVPREVGGLDKSAADISEMLGEQYVRQYWDDGCVREEENEETGGHDGEEGCEYAEE